MEKEVDNDTQQYCDEWFNIAILTGKEFDLPNLSDTLIRWWVDDGNLAMLTYPLQYPDLVPTLPMDNQQVRASSSLINNPSMASNLSLEISKNQVCVPSFLKSRRHGFNGGSIPMRNQLPHVPSSTTINFPSRNPHPRDVSFGGAPPCFSSTDSFPLKNRQIHVHSFTDSSWFRMKWKPPRSYLNGSLMSNAVSAQIKHVPGTTSTRWSCCNSCSLMSNRANSNGSTPMSNQPTLVPRLNSNDSNLAKGEEELVTKKCSECNISFGSGNALGGHMSSHAKKRKMEAMRRAGQPFNSKNSFFRLVDQLGFGDGSTGSSLTPSVSAITSTDEKNEGNGSSIEREEMSSKTADITTQRSSPPRKVPKKEESF